MTAKKVFRNEFENKIQKEVERKITMQAHTQIVQIQTRVKLSYSMLLRITTEYHCCIFLRLE